MTLFDDQPKNDLQRAVALVEQTVRTLGLDPAQARLKSAGVVDAYSLQRGSASLLVMLQEGSRPEDKGSIRVVAPVVALPNHSAAQLTLFRRLLEANGKELANAAFAIVNDQVAVISERTVEDLDASEVDRMIRTVGRVADRYDDALASEFGVQRVADHSA